MENELKGSRKISLSGHDLELASSNRNISSTRRIREKEIFKFCGSCDMYRKSNECDWQGIDATEQAERVAIDLCTMASRDNQIGRMTSIGFLPYERKSIRAALLKRFRR